MDGLEMVGRVLVEFVIFDDDQASYKGIEAQVVKCEVGNCALSFLLGCVRGLHD